MSKDPAFLFYDGDAARDVSHMNRLERGAYFDLIQAQRKFGGFTMEQARKILGKDFDLCWDSLSLILVHENDIFLIEWVRDSIDNRKQYSEKQRKRIQDYWDKKKKEDSIPRNNGGISTDIPLESENESENEIDNSIGNKGGKGGKSINIPFETFWDLYGKKEGAKNKCEQKWNKLSDSTRQKIVETLPAFLKSKTDRKYIPFPETYLNQERWNDVIEAKPKQEMVY